MVKNKAPPLFSFKESISTARGQLTPDTIARHSEMVGLTQELKGIYDRVSISFEINYYFF